MIQRKEVFNVSAILLLSCLLSAMPVTAQSILLNARREFATQGRQPESVVSADFNLDGWKDLLVTISHTSSDGPPGLRMLFGNGDGTFQTGGLFGTGGNSFYVAVGDLNNDGKQDAAVSNGGSTSGSVAVLLGNNNGTFQLPLISSSGSFSRDIAIRDFDLDGIQDVAVLNSGSPPNFDVNNNVAILIGNGDGTLKPPVNFSVGPQPLGMTVCDFNNDAKADIAVKFSGSTDPDGGLSLLMGNGNGTFQSAVTLRTVSRPHAVLAGDFNADGNADLAVTGGNGFGPLNLHILIGNGNGTFMKPVDYDIGAFALSLIQNDFNSDGKADLAVLNKNSFDISLLFGNGNGTFQPAVTFIAGRDPSSIISTDFNGDGLPDLANVNELTDSVSIHLNKGAGSFASESNFGVGAPQTRHVLVADFNHDCKLDVATANSGTNNISVLLGNGNGTMQAPMILAAGVEPNHLAVGDFDNDNDPDIAVSNAGVPFSNPGGVSILLGNGNGTFQPPMNFPTADAPVNSAVGNFNQDNNADLAVVNFRSNTVSIMLGQGNGTFQAAPALVFQDLSGLTSVVVGDFNHDGIADLAVTSEFQALIAIFSGNGNGTFAPSQVISFPITQSIGIIKAADLDKDGNLDLVTSSHIVRRGIGNGTFQPLPDVEASGSTDVTIVDLNGDGNLDLAFANLFSMRIEVNAGNGDGTFQLPVRFISGGLPQSISAGDFNGDRKPDLVTTNVYTFTQGVDNISLLFNRKLMWKALKPSCPVAAL